MEEKEQPKSIHSCLWEFWAKIDKQNLFLLS